MRDYQTKARKLTTTNNDFQHFEVIKTNRNKRFADKEFFVEGVRNINEAIRNNFKIKTLIYDGEKPLSEWARNILKNTREYSLFSLSTELMQKISDKEEPSELITLVEMPEDDITKLTPSANPVFVIFDRPSNKGNLGSIIRSCDALGADGLIITGHAVDLYDPETIRASMGSFFKMPLVRVPSFNEIRSWLQGLKTQYPAIQFIGTSEKGQKDIDECDFSGPVVLFLGNEAEGLSFNYEQLSDSLARIPMAPNSAASSLNVASSASIFLYEILRQRKHLNQSVDSRKE